MAPISLATGNVSEVIQADPIASNLLGGVTPFLGLLGEAFTNKYLSQTVDTCDWFAFCFVPTGVPYATRALYRVGQASKYMQYVKWPNAEYCHKMCDSVERDLLASTSEHVCQIWNGYKTEKRITKTAKPLVKEFIFVDSNLKDSKDKPDLGFQPQKKCQLLGNKILQSMTPKELSALDWISPPNMMLNLTPYKRVRDGRCLAAVGFVLQMSIITLAALSAFYQPFFSRLFYGQTRAMRIIAFVFVASGTLLLTLGLYYTWLVLSSAAYINIWKPPTQKPIIIVWIQRQDDSENTEGYIIGKKIEMELLSAHRMMEASSPCCHYFFILVTTSGFILQSVGLSLMHWPTQVLQLLSMIIMFLGRWKIRKQGRPDFAIPSAHIHTFDEGDKAFSRAKSVAQHMAQRVARGKV